jgi:hypothetical protein
MRNTTKLKHILLAYTLTISMSDDEEMTFKLVNKLNGETQTFTDASYSKLLSKAFSFMNKRLKSF